MAKAVLVLNAGSSSIEFSVSSSAGFGPTLLAVGYEPIREWNAVEADDRPLPA